MARPKKNADELLTETVLFRTSLATRENLTTKAQAAGLGESEFMRFLVDDTPLPSGSSTDPALIAALNNYTVALSRIGNNVNQLAQATHTGREFTKFWREIGEELQAELKAARDALHESLEGVRE